MFWFGDGGTDQKTGGRAEGGRVKDVEILFGRDKRMDRINIEHIRGKVKVICFGDKVGARLRWLDMCRGGTVNILVEG